MMIFGFQDENVYKTHPHPFPVSQGRELAMKGNACVREFPSLYSGRG
jgi:hypothetical protein